MRIHAFASVATALLFAGLAPATACFAITGNVLVIPPVLVIALGHAMILGLPSFLLGRSLGRVNLVFSAVVGFVIGAGPTALLTLLTQGSANSASINGVPTVINGVTTLAGWWYNFSSWIFLGGFGALGGIAFCLILKVTGGAIRADNEAAAPVTSRVALVTSCLAILAILLTGAALAIPVIADLTCHNMLSFGRTSVRSKVNIRLAIPVEDWQRLTRLFEEFGGANDLSFRNSNIDDPGTVRVLGLSLCNSQGLVVHAIEQHWERTGNLVPEKDGVALGIYELREGSNWTHAARALIAELEANWPGKVQFKDGGGRIIPEPGELRDAH